MAPSFKKSAITLGHHPYLGVGLSLELTWKTHICNITSKANRKLNLLNSINSIQFKFMFIQVLDQTQT